VSHFTITCPWCGERYTFGIVGTQQVGSGHECTTRIECSEDGCHEAGVVQTVERLGPDGPEGARFVCPDHITAIIMAWQPRATTEL
jgi:hypothetical protein